MTEGRVLDPSGMTTLVDILRSRGHRVVGPIVRDGVIVLDEIDSADRLPWGWADVQSPGGYELVRRDDGACFGYVVGPTSLRRFLAPPERPVWHSRRTDDGIVFEAADPEPPSYAFLGVRACDLAALVARAGVPDPWAERVRAASVFIAVECVTAAATCFCASVGTGPAVTGGHDLAITELFDGEHRFLLRSGTETGEALLAELGGRPAADSDLEEARTAVASTASSQERSLDPSLAREVLADGLRHPHWDEMAQRCLSCTNCTMVCPTCFCTTSASDHPVGSTSATLVERWDSCFTVDFTHLHGAGSVRPDTRAQYRQWLTHKLSTWWDQFGTSGCVGCGRCIAWCPAGIDLTAEVPVFAGGDR